MTGLETGELILVLGALAASSFLKGLTGLGLPLISVPVIAAFIGVEPAVIILIIPGLATNLWLMWQHRRYREFPRQIVLFCLVGLAGAVAGTWFLASVSDKFLSLTLGFWIAFYLIFIRLKPHFRLSGSAGARIAPAAGLLAGLAQGATAISGPIVATFFHALKPSQRGYVFAISAAFCVMAASQLFSALYFGLFSEDRAVLGVLALAPALLAMPLGIWLSTRLGDRRFDAFIQLLLFAMMIKLLISGFGGP